MALDEQSIGQLVAEALDAFATATSTAALKEARLAHLGDRSPLALANREIGSLPGPERKDAGQRLGAARARLTEAFTARQAEVEAAEVEATSGGGAVTVRANGAKKIISVKISPDAVDPDDVEMLEDLITAAVNEALSKAEELMQQKMGGITGGMNLGGLF